MRVRRAILLLTLLDFGGGTRRRLSPTKETAATGGAMPAVITSAAERAG